MSQKNQEDERVPLTDGFTDEEAGQQGVPATEGMSAARRTLREKYESGDIDETEYQKRIAALFAEE
jgi:uncharacterized membrane protein